MRQTFRAKTSKIFPIVLTFCVGITGLTIFSSPVLAQTTYSPQFNLGQRVYIDPALAKHPTYPVQFHDIDRQLAAIEQQHQIHIYVVAAGQQDYITSTQTNQAVVELDNLLAHWRKQPEFPKNTYLTIFWLRRSDNVDRGWVAANAGRRLRAKGLTKDAFSNPDGLIIPVLKQYMPSDPQGAILTIVQNVNQVLEKDELEQQAILQLKHKQIVRQQQEQEERRVQQLKRQQQEQEQLKQFQRYLPSGIIVLLVAGTLSGLCINFRRRRIEARLIICSWQERLNNANRLYSELYDRYFDFLNVRSNWTKVLQGETRSHYQAAVSDFVELTIRLEAVNLRLQYAIAARGGNFFPLTGGFEKARASLKSLPITATGEDVTLEMADLFAGKTLEISEEPEQMLATMADLFAGTSRKLALIARTFQSLEEIRDWVEQLCLKITGTEEKLNECSIPFDPIQCRLLQVQQRWRKQNSNLNFDPLAHLADACLTKQAFEAIALDMERLLVLYSELNAARIHIDTVALRVQNVRASSVDYNYPPLSGDRHKEPHQLFALAEKGGNPDCSLTEAYEHWQAAQHNLLEAELDKSQSLHTLALAAADQAEQTIESVKTAKVFVEKQVLLAIKDIDTLAKAIPLAGLALSKLQKEFLAHNYLESLKKFDNANLIYQTVNGQLAQIKLSYDCQHYLDAKQKLESLGKCVQTSIQELEQIHAHLAHLQYLSQQTKDTTAHCQALVQNLKSLQGQQEFTTAIITISDCQQVYFQLDQLLHDITQQKTDWVVATDSANQLLQKLQALFCQINQQFEQYQQAITLAQQLQARISAISIIVNNPDTLLSAREQFKQVCSCLEQLQAELAAPYSNWAIITNQLDRVKLEAEECHAIALDNKKAAKKVRTALEQAIAAAQKANRSYRYSISADLITTNRLISNAREKLEGGEYDIAMQYARKAILAASTLR